MNRKSAAGACVAPLLLPFLLAAACTGIEPELRSLMQQTNPEEGEQAWHTGPPVAVADSGPAPYARVLHEAFRPARAMELVTFIDRFYRAPANDGYEEVIARLAKGLREMGFDGTDDRLDLELLEGEEVDAWTPVSAELVLHVEGEEARTLHAFAKSEDVDRVMLPVHAPSCDLRTEVALRLDRCPRLKSLRSPVAQQIQGLTQGAAPFLVPSGLASGLTAAVPDPAADAMSAGPGRALPSWAWLDFGLPLRGKAVQEFAIVSDEVVASACLVFQPIRQGAVTPLGMMPIGLAVRGEVHNAIVSFGRRPNHAQ
jgi:hypothetical protein